MPISKAAVRRRLRARIQIDPETGCHVYCGAWSKRGAAIVCVGHRTYTVQQVVCWLNGKAELWEKVYRYRICQTPACANQRHIKIAASFSEALADMRRLGLYSLKGYKKLTKTRRACIRLLAKEGHTAKEIAADLGMRTAKIQRVIDGVECHGRQNRKAGHGRPRKSRVP